MSSSISRRTVTVWSSSTSIDGLHGVAAGSSTLPSTVQVYLAIVRPVLAFDPTVERDGQDLVGVHPQLVEGVVAGTVGGVGQCVAVAVDVPVGGTDQSKRASGRPCGGVANT